MFVEKSDVCEWTFAMHSGCTTVRPTFAAQIRRGSCHSITVHCHRAFKALSQGLSRCDEIHYHIQSKTIDCQSRSVDAGVDIELILITEDRVSDQIDERIASKATRISIKTKINIIATTSPPSSAASSPSDSAS